MISTFLAAAVFLPLAGVVLAAARHRLKARLIAKLACVAVAVAALSALGALAAWLAGAESTPQRLVLASWIRIGEVEAPWALRVDSLSLLMVAVVSSVSALVHVYALAYMKPASALVRFYAYLGLFTFAMLMLAASDNLLQLFFGWEGVGLCSYLLIGFHHERDKASRAAVKAFIVNRVGDFAFLLGMVGLFVMYGSLQFDALFAAADAADASHMTAHAVLMALLLFGAMGKSAQLGLHSWLPDAMEGPAPVSALIHAATMVTAGVFLLARLSPLFVQAPDVLVITALIGGATCLFAAACAFAQNDIKRMIAWSTCSQLGYMFLALGVAAWGAAMFHLVTHAFFKALLFLGAGAVIQAAGGVQDLRSLGGAGGKGRSLARAMPLTCAFMWAGALALAGAPFLSGYYSKDLILEAAWGASSASPWIASALAMALAAALLTAAYSLRLMVSVFHRFHAVRPARRSAMQVVGNAPCDPPPLMLVPMAILAVGALVAGIAGVNAFSDAQENGWWRGALDAVSNARALQAVRHLPAEALWLPLFLALLGAFLYWLLGVRRVLLPLPQAATLFLGRFFSEARAKAIVATPVRLLMAAFLALAGFLRRGLCVDGLYRRLFVAPTTRLASNLARVVERDIIDTLGPAATAAAVSRAGRFVAALHNGRVNVYAFTVLTALAVLLAWRAAGVLENLLP